MKLTFQGADTGEIITGAHIDSINTNDEGVMSKAPGADDNASGVSVVTEVIRILVDKAYMPSHKIVFFAYAAEEVGLKGSFEIAESYQNKEANVLGVLNIDGTNYNGSAQKIVLIDDNTDGEQNKFIGELIDTYINVPWGYDSCDYACSDHYAWTYRGYKASFPAEASI